MNSSGWIKLHRRFLEWEWYGDGNMVRLFLHLLLKANHEPKRWRGILIQRGQLISGRKILSKELGLGEQVIRTCLKRLEVTNELTIKSNPNFSIFTLNSYDLYQSKEEANQQTNQQLTSEQPSSNQQLTTNKNDKNVRTTRSISVKRKHSFEKSPFYGKKEFREALSDWPTEKVKEYWEKADTYSRANGGRYLDWILAVRAWERKHAEQAKTLPRSKVVPKSEDLT